MSEHSAHRLAPTLSRAQPPFAMRTSIAMPPSVVGRVIHTPNSRHYSRRPAPPRGGWGAVPPLLTQGLPRCPTKSASRLYLTTRGRRSHARSVSHGLRRGTYNLIAEEFAELERQILLFKIPLLGGKARIKALAF
jgi:hypothetical protein